MPIHDFGVTGELWGHWSGNSKSIQAINWKLSTGTFLRPCKMPIHFWVTGVNFGSPESVVGHWSITQKVLELST